MIFFKEVHNTRVESEENPLDIYCIVANETVLINNSHFGDEFTTIAPREGHMPLSILNDCHWEELAHPHLFPTGKFCYQVQRDPALFPVKYFNQRFLNYTLEFASDTDYIFFGQSVLLKLNLKNQIKIATHKVYSDKLTAGMLSEDFKEKVCGFIATDQAFNFMSCIKGTSDYWKKFLFDVLAMVTQLGIFTLFLTLSYADLR